MKKPVVIEWARCEGDIEEEPSIVSRAWFWIGVIASLLLWTVLALLAVYVIAGGVK